MVKKLAAEGKLKLSQSKAVAYFNSESEAIATAKDVIAKLSALNYSCTLQQIDECDEYGVMIGTAGYHLKLTIFKEPQLMIVSLHPLLKPIKTKKGTVNP